MLDDLDEDELKELYQSIVLEHSKKPLNFGFIDNITPIYGHNPSCGDKVILYVNKENNKVTDIKFQGEGCALCLASTSIMTSIIKNKDIPFIKKLISEFSSLIQGNIPAIESDHLEVLNVFKQVKNFPSRGKCVMLGWRALEKSIES
jgi:nitrogen fixation NifU-like protein